ncbi:helix-turn-helix domain-containing protein [Amycolatopsis sp. NPDC005003]
MSQNKNDQPNQIKPETAESKVRRALEAYPGTTAANLASMAGVGRSTATKILSRWAAEGLVTRTDGKDQSVPVTWTMRDGQAEDTPKTGDDAGVAGEDDTESASSPSPTPDAPTKDRLPKGGLYDLVKTYLYEHPGEEFGPAKIGTELGRSSGAVNNALEKMVTDGLATKTCEAPKRFAAC